MKKSELVKREIEKIWDHMREIENAQDVAALRRASEILKRQIVNRPASPEFNAIELAQYVHAHGAADLTCGIMGKIADMWERNGK